MKHKYYKLVSQKPNTKYYFNKLHLSEELQPLCGATQRYNEMLVVGEVKADYTAHLYKLMEKKDIQTNLFCNACLRKAHREDQSE